jgi:hypothetical protein
MLNLSSQNILGLAPQPPLEKAQVMDAQGEQPVFGVHDFGPDTAECTDRSAQEAAAAEFGSGGLPARPLHRHRRWGGGGRVPADGCAGVPARCGAAGSALYGNLGLGQPRRVGQRHDHRPRQQPHRHGGDDHPAGDSLLAVCL